MATLSAGKIRRRWARTHARLSFPHTSLRTVMLAVFGLLMAFSVAVFGTLVIREAINSETRLSNYELQDLANSVASRLDVEVYRRRQQILSIASVENLAAGARGASSLRPTLENLQRIYGDWAWIGFVEPSGNVLFSTDGVLEGSDLSERPWWREALYRPYIGDVHAALLLAEKLPHLEGDALRFMDVGAPVLNGGGNVLGVVAAHLSWTAMGEVVDQSIGAFSGELDDAEVLIVDGDRVLLHRRVAGDRQILAERAGGNGAVPESPAVDMIAMTSPTRGYREYAGLGWQVIVRQPQVIAHRNAYRLAGSAGILTVVMGGFVFGMGWIVSVWMTAPIARLRRAVAAARADAAEVPNIPVSRRYAEAYELSLALRSTFQGLRREAQSRAENEAALAEEVAERAAAEERLSTILEEQPDGMVIVDEVGTIAYANGRAEAYFGRNREKLMGAPFGLPVVNGETTEIEITRGGRSPLPVEMHTVAFTHQSRPGQLVSIRDISQRKAAEKAAADSEALARSVLDNVENGFITCDEAGIIETFNPAAGRIFGYEESEVTGCGFSMLMSHEMGDESGDYMRRYFEAGDGKILGVGAREVEGRRKSGETFPLEWSISEMTLDGRTVFIFVISDISERKRTQEQLQQLQKIDAIGQLTGGIAHDFNNLLAVIMGNLQLVQRRHGDEDPKLAKQVERALNAATRGADLTKRLLAFSRRQVLQSEIADINDIVGNVIELMSRTIGDSITVRTDLGEDLACVKVDVGQMENALVNLAVNARDAMPDGGRLAFRTECVTFGEVDLARYSYLQAGDYVAVNVSDTGTGMSKEVQEKLFEPFFTTKEKGKGTGLGMSMVFGFVKQSGGYLHVYSEVGQGTTIKIYLPAARGDVDANVDTRADDRGVPEGTETILLVDDDTEVRKTARQSLKALGYTVREASDGPSALEALRRDGAPDLLFTDFAMPGGLDGADLIREVRRQNPGLRAILYSGFGESQKVEALTSGEEGVGFLGKPYSDRALAVKVREVLDA